MMEEHLAFERARFKRLAHNDTGSAKGHQGGVLIPKPLASYFPILSSTGSAVTPTDDQYITATLVVGTTVVGKVETRYQHQTWGGTRPAERRITGELQLLLGGAAKDDLLIIERNSSNPLEYRLTLHKVGTLSYKSYQSKIGLGRWGQVAP
jgi:putative restriction endonuclease